MSIDSFPEHGRRFFGSLEDIKPVPSPANFSEVESIFMTSGWILDYGHSMTPEQSLELAHVELTAAMDKLAENTGCVNA